MHNPAIAAHSLQIVRDGVTIVRGMDFAIPAGTVTGLIGPSGSGKTTLMRAIVGAQAIAGGDLKILGMPAGSRQLRDKVGYVTQAPAVYDDLTARQNLRYFAAQLGCSEPESEVTRVLHQVDLARQSDQLVGAMSGGQRARVSLAVALLGRPAVLVLDEPTVGLDPVLRRSLWRLFSELAASGCGLLISSHVMDEAEQCPELLLLRDGRVLYHGTRPGLLVRTRTRTVNDAFLNLAEGSA